MNVNERIKDKLEKLRNLNKRISILGGTSYNKYNDEIKLNEIEDVWEENDEIFDDVLTSLEIFYCDLGNIIDDIEDLVDILE